MTKKLIVGIDEVGRGPVAGPVSIGIVLCRTELSIPELNDSKQMTEKARERVYALAETLRMSGDIEFGVYSETADVIDQKGIEHALRSAIQKGLHDMNIHFDEVEIKLDGRLKAPREFLQESIIHGDSLIPAISLASVVAKVERDRYMVEEVHRAYPEYGFDAHKGYGTAAHIAAIKQNGLSPLHRVSFLRRVLG